MMSLASSNKLNPSSDYQYPAWYWLIICIAITCIFTLCLGNVRDYDLQHYHLYNGYAFWQQRWLWDYRPAGLHSYFNPLLDALNYKLISQLPAYGTTIVIACLQGISYWLTMCIAFFFFQKTALRHPQWWAFLAAINGLWAITITRQLGGFNNDLINSAFVLFSLLQWFIVINTLSQSQQPKRWRALLSGLSMGIAVGLKLTMALFAISLIITALTATLLYRHKMVLIYLIIGMMIGFGLTDGWWAWYLWVHFHNPVFPFYNAVFHSPQWPLINSSDPNFHLQHKATVFILPILLFFNLHLALVQTGYDIRYLLVYALLLLLLARSLLQRFYQRKIRPNHSFTVCEQQLLTFSIVSFILWAWLFLIYRYLCPLTLLVPSIIFLILEKIQPSTAASSRYGLLFLILSCTTPISSHVPLTIPSPLRFQFKKQITSHKNALVLLNNTHIWTHLIASFPKGWRFINAVKSSDLCNDKNKEFITNYPPSQRILDHYIHWADSNHFPIYLLTTETQKLIPQTERNTFIQRLMRKQYHRYTDKVKIRLKSTLQKSHLTVTPPCTNLIENYLKKHPTAHLNDNAYSVKRTPILCSLHLTQPDTKKRK